MGWPRINDKARLYYEKADRSYLLLITENGPNSQGFYDAVANAQASSLPCLASTTVAPTYIHNKCKRVEWRELPEVWKEAFLKVMKDWDEKPADIVGFWKVNEPKIYEFVLDGPLFRKQRQLIDRLQTDLLTEADRGLLQGIANMFDAIADQAHDKYGIDCLLENPVE